VPSNLVPITALSQSIENKLAWWRIEPKNSAAFRCFFSVFDHGAALKIDRKMSHLNIAFDRYASIGHCNSLHFGNKRPDSCMEIAGKFGTCAKSMTKSL